MLCQFTVKNFKSIRDEVTFDMQAAAISEHEDRIIKDKDEELYLRYLLYTDQMVEANLMFLKRYTVWLRRC